MSSIAAPDRQLEHRTYKEMLPVQNAEILGKKVAVRVKRAVGRFVLSARPLLGFAASQVNQALMCLAAVSARPRTIQYPTPARVVGQIKIVFLCIHARYAEIAFAEFARSRSMNFWILPVDVFGIAPNTTDFGDLNPGKMLLQ